MSAEYRVYSPFPLCDWHECLRALGVLIFDGKGGMTPYDPSRHYIEETGRALKAWVTDRKFDFAYPPRAGVRLCRGAGGLPAESAN